MAIRRPLSVPLGTYSTLRAVHILTGESYGAIVDKAARALLASDKELAAKVAKVLEAVAA